MNLYKKTFLIFLLNFFSIYTTEDIDTEFPQHDTDQYNYSVHTQEETATEQDQAFITKPEIISDVTYNHYFDTGKTRTKITKSLQDNKQIITTEKWITKNASYLTKLNGSLIAAFILTFLGLQYIKYLTAYHESGHALMAALVLDDNSAAEYATINSSIGRFGSFAYAQFKSPCTYLSTKEDLLQYHKNQIMMFLSGGIGIDIYREKRLPASTFLDSWQTFMKGMGSWEKINRDSPSDDLSMVVRNAGLYALVESDQYTRLPNGEILIDGKVAGDKVLKIIEKSYEDAYDILHAHKDRLDTMANSLYCKSTIHSPEIYDIAGMDYPQKEF